MFVFILVLVIYFVSFLVLQSSCRGRESWLLCFCCLMDVLLLWLFLLVPWIGQQCVIVVFPDHTHLLFHMKPAVPELHFDSKQGNNF